MGQKLRSQTRSGSMRVQYLHQTEGGAVTNKRATAVYRLKDKKKKNKQNKEKHNKAEGKGQVNCSDWSSTGTLLSRYLQNQDLNRSTTQPI